MKSFERDRIKYKTLILKKAWSQIKDSGLIIQPPLGYDIQKHRQHVASHRNDNRTASLVHFCLLRRANSLNYCKRTTAERWRVIIHKGPVVVTVYRYASPATSHRNVVVKTDAAGWHRRVFDEFLCRSKKSFLCRHKSYPSVVG